jgi:hypothetical protein
VFSLLPLNPELGHACYWQHTGTPLGQTQWHIT